jgi:hypothetical protein
MGMLSAAVSSAVPATDITALNATACTSFSGKNRDFFIVYYAKRQGIPRQCSQARNV